MKDIKKRIEALERRAFYKANQVCVLGRTDDGMWRMNIDGIEKFYNTEAEAREEYKNKTGPDSVLIVWDL